MSDGFARTLSILSRRLLPFGTALVAVLFDLLPLPDSAPHSLAPSVTICVFAYWALLAPELMSPTATFVIGLVLDAVGGLPLGLTSLALLLVRSALLTGERFLVAQPFATLWGCFVLIALAVALIRWLLASLWWGRMFGIQPILFQAVLTIAFYPVVSAVLSVVHHRLVAPAHAARS